jgi:hypothetical protein
MRRPFRLAVLSSAIAVMAVTPPANAQTELQSKSHCAALCTAAAAGCMAAAAAGGVSAEACLGFLDGCLYGCSV